MFGCLALIAVATSQDSATPLQELFPNVPENHAIYRLLGDLEWPYSFFDHRRPVVANGRPSNRGEIVQAVAQRIRDIRARLAKALTETRPADPGWWGPGTCRNHIDFFSSRWKYDLATVLIAFDRYFRAAGEDPNKLRIRLNDGDEVAAQATKIWQKNLAKIGGKPQYVDVPFRFWASDDVQELRDAGIMIGDPDGRFYGG